MDDAVLARDGQRIGTVLWRGKHLIAISTTIMLVLAIVWTLHAEKVYQATGIIQVSIPGQGASPEATSANQAVAQNLATLFVSPGMLRKIGSKIDGGKLSAGDLEGRLSAKAVEATALVQIKATGPSPAAAQRLGTKTAEAFIAELQSEAGSQAARQQAQIQTTIAQLSGKIDSLRETANSTVPPTSEQISALEASRQALITQNASLVVDSLARGASATLSAPPVASSSPIRPRTMLNVIGGILVGLVIGVGLAWLYDRVRPWVRSAEEAATVLDAALLASIPLRPRLKEKDPVLEESYEVLRANLSLALRDIGKPFVTVLGPNAKAGKTSTVEGVARVAARGGRSVVIIDGDMRAATLTSRLVREAGLTSRDNHKGGRQGRASHPGLSDILEGTASIKDVLIELGPSMSLLPTRRTSANPSSLLSGSRMRELCGELREQFDIVLVDSPPLIGIADGLLLASISDAVVVVARTGVTKPADLTSVATSMQQTHTPIAGLVVFEQRTVSEYYYPTRIEQSAPAADPAVLS